MKEQEAQDHWCPFVSSDGRTYGAHASTTQSCIGSKCMAWRWNYTRSPAAGEDTGNRQGHCGLAGKEL